MSKIRKTGKLTKASKQLAKKFAEFLKKLPEEDLLYLAQTPDQQDIWYECRGGCTLIGTCFQSRFCGEKDPIRSWKTSEDDIKRVAYVWVWKIVQYLEELWGLVQLSFHDVEEMYIQSGNTFPFTEPYQLFFEINRIDENNRFRKVLQPTLSIFDLTTDDKIYALVEKKLRQGILTDKEEVKLAKFRNRRTQSGNFKNIWLDIVLLACQDLSKSDQLIADKLQDLQRLGASICQFQSKTYSDARKNRNDLEIRSEEWIDGFRYIRPPNRRKSSQAKGKS